MVFGLGGVGARMKRFFVFVLLRGRKTCQSLSYAGFLMESGDSGNALRCNGTERARPEE